MVTRNELFQIEYLKECDITGIQRGLGRIYLINGVYSVICLIGVSNKVKGKEGKRVKSCLF